MITNQERQAFDIWYADKPELTFDDARLACSGLTHRELARRIFHSSKFEFKRWLMTSGFQQFIDSQSEQENAMVVFRNLWEYMKINEKTVSN